MSHPIEDRLRDAYQAKTAQLTEARLDQLAATRDQGLDGLLGGQHTAELPMLDLEAVPAVKRQHRWIAPSLAAAAVAALAIGVTAVAGIQHESKPKPNPPATHVSTPPPSTNAPAPSTTPSQTVVAPPYLPAGQTGSRSQVPWSVVGSGWRLLQPIDGDLPSSNLYLYDPEDGRYLISDALPTGASVQAWSPDGQRALLSVLSQRGTVTSYYELSLRSGRSALVLKRNSSHFVTYTKPTGRSFLIQENLTPETARLSRYSTQGTRALTYPTSAGGNRVGSGSAIYTPDGSELVLQSVDGVSVLLGNDGHYIRTFRPPSGYARCSPGKLWTAATLLEFCWRTTDSRSALFIQPLSGGASQVLIDSPGPFGSGYLNAWQLSNGHVLLQAFANCLPGGYQILHRDSGAITALRGPNGVPTPQFITHMDNDVATFRVGGGGCDNRPAGTPALVDYNMVTGQTRTLLDQDAQIVHWPGDRG